MRVWNCASLVSSHLRQAFCRHRRFWTRTLLLGPTTYLWLSAFSLTGAFCPPLGHISSIQALRAYHTQVRLSAFASMSQPACSRKSERAASSRSKSDDVTSEEVDDSTHEEKKETDNPKPKKRKSPAKKEPSASKKKSATSKKRAPSTKDASPATKQLKTTAQDESDVVKSSATKERAKAAVHQRITERDELPKLWSPSEASKGSYTFKIASWNIAGLRAILRNNPNALSDLVQKHDLDVLCLQETKLQEMHLTDPKVKLNGGDLIEGYDAYWSCSTGKKGYAGTAVFVKQRGSSKKKKQSTLTSFFGSDKNATTQEDFSPNAELDSEMISNLIPTEVSYQMGKEEHDAEGRIVTLDFPLFSFSNVYVPNSGQKLERLNYRTEQWDKDLLNFMQTRQSNRGVPVMWLGDLNVAHTNLEVWNDGAKHLPKQAGVTPQERASFQAQLDAGFVDAFRHLHPEAQGHYSYWSQRSGNREPNKGLRLDYFVCSPSLFDDSEKVVVRDCYMIYDQNGSDHCPVVLEMEIKK